MPKIHDLKIWPHQFDDVDSGLKTFEIRLNDRAYQVGDILRLCEFRPKVGTYTGRECKRKIVYRIDASDRNEAPWERGLQPGWCVLGLGDVEA